MAAPVTRFRSLIQSVQGLKAPPPAFRSGLLNHRAVFSRLLCDRVIDRPDQGPQIPVYNPPENEPVHLKRARLLYQSRKRGMSENGLLLSTFADQYLNDMDEATLVQYDKVINRPSNDWELYYWITEAKPTPQEYEGPVMDMLKVHAKNRNMDVRIRQPDLQPLDN